MFVVVCVLLLFCVLGMCCVLVGCCFLLSCHAGWFGMCVFFLLYVGVAASLILFFSDECLSVVCAVCVVPRGVCGLFVVCFVFLFWMC